MAKATKSTKTTRQSGSLQSFAVLSPVKHDGEDYEIGDEISIDKDTFDDLSAAKAIEGEWSDEPVPGSPV